jgi:polyhydroxybutyrate depolymerase
MLKRLLVCLALGCGSSPTKNSFDASTGSPDAAAGSADGAGQPDGGGGPSIDAQTSSSFDAPSGSCNEPAGLRSGVTITAGGAARTYTIQIADPSLPRQRVVFAFHGDGGTGDGVRSSLALEAAATGPVIFVYPDGINADPVDGGAWDLDTTAAAGNVDIALFDAILARLEADNCVDSTHVFVTGFSRGGFYANWLGCQRGDVIRAIAPQSGGGPYGTNYNSDGMLICPTPPVPALVIHGNADTTVPNDEFQPDGGWQAFEHWAYWNHATPRSTTDYQQTTAVSPSPCAQANLATVPVIRCFIDGLGHAPWTDEATTVMGFFASF